MRYSSAKTWVCWDINSCPVPDGFDSSLVSTCIESALTKEGCFGPLTIAAVGNLKHTLKHVLRTIYSTGIVLKHGPGGFSYTLAQLLKWTDANPPPANLLFIMGVEEIRRFTGVLYDLQCRRYNIFLAYPMMAIPQEFSPYLFYMKKFVWETLLEGAVESVKGKKRHKCETDWSCTVCECSGRCYAGKSFDEFAVHFKTRGHSLSELDMVPRPMHRNRNTKLDTGPSRSSDPCTTNYMKRSFEEGGGKRKMDPNAKTWVCWHADTCPVPDGFDARLLSPCIESALKYEGYSGPVAISVTGNLKHILQRASHDVLRTIFSTGIPVEHAHGGFPHIFENVIQWTRENPPPANLMFITGDPNVRNYSQALHTLEDIGYTILLVHPRVVFSILAFPLEPPFVCWEALLEEGGRSLVNKCCEMVSEWSCTVCKRSGKSLAGKSHEDFILHLKTREHALSELDRWNFVRTEEDRKIEEEEEDRLSL